MAATIAEKSVSEIFAEKMVLDGEIRKDLVSSTKMEMPNLELISELQMEDAPAYGDWHCPGRDAMQMQAMACLEEIRKMNITKLQLMKTEIIWWIAAMMPVIGLAYVPQIYNILQLMVQMGMAIMLWKICCFALEMTKYQQSAVAHCSRLEYNFVCLGGRTGWFLVASLLISRPTWQTWSPKPLRCWSPSPRSWSRDEQGSN